MLPDERERVAKAILRRFAQVFGTSGNDLFDEAFAAKLILIGASIDHAATAAKHPLHVTNILPGFGLLVIKAESLDSTVIRRFGEDIQHSNAIDHRVTESLSHLLQQELNQAEGACLYKAEDCTTYLLFQSKFTKQALGLIGVTPEGVEHVH